jgi:hypothetical protein
MTGMDSPEAIPWPPARKRLGAVLGVATTISFQVIVSIALYPSGQSDFVRFAIPPLVSAIVIGAILSFVLRLYKPGACFIALFMACVAWVMALMISINTFGA